MTERDKETGPKLSHDDVVRLCGNIEDWKVLAIIRTGADVEELEEAVAFSVGEDDVMGEERKSLTGRVGEIHEILTADEAEDEE